MAYCHVSAQIDEHCRSLGEDDALDTYREKAWEELEAEPADFGEVLAEHLSDDGRELADRILLAIAFGKDVPADLAAKFRTTVETDLDSTIDKRAEQMRDDARGY